MAIGLGLMATLTLAGCGADGKPAAAPARVVSASSAGGPAHPVVGVSFWESHSATNQQGEAIAQIVAAFNRDHPDVRVTVHVTPASAQALAAVQAGDPPVMAMIGHAPQYGYEQGTRARPIEVGLSLFQGFDGNHWRELAAASVMTLVPIILVFLLTQPYFAVAGRAGGED